MEEDSLVRLTTNCLESLGSAAALRGGLLCCRTCRGLSGATPLTSLQADFIRCDCAMQFDTSALWLNSTRIPKTVFLAFERSQEQPAGLAILGAARLLRRLFTFRAGDWSLRNLPQIISLLDEVSLVVSFLAASNISCCEIRTACFAATVAGKQSVTNAWSSRMRDSSCNTFSLRRAISSACESVLLSGGRILTASSSPWSMHIGIVFSSGIQETLRSFPRLHSIELIPSADPLGLFSVLDVRTSGDGKVWSASAGFSTVPTLQIGSAWSVQFSHTQFRLSESEYSW